MFTNPTLLRITAGVVVLLGLGGAGLSLSSPAGLLLGLGIALAGGIALLALADLASRMNADDYDQKGNFGGSLAAPDAPAYSSAPAFQAQPPLTPPQRPAAPPFERTPLPAAPPAPPTPIERAPLPSPPPAAPPMSARANPPAPPLATPTAPPLPPPMPPIEPPHANQGANMGLMGLGATQKLSPNDLPPGLSPQPETPPPPFAPPTINPAPDFSFSMPPNQPPTAPPAAGNMGLMGLGSTQRYSPIEDPVSPFQLDLPPPPPAPPAQGVERTQKYDGTPILPFQPTSNASTAPLPPPPSTGMLDATQRFGGGAQTPPPEMTQKFGGSPSVPTARLQGGFCSACGSPQNHDSGQNKTPTGWPESCWYCGAKFV